LYSNYIKEREGFSIVESDRGFATYKIQGNECYIRDIYVLPLYRNTKLASDMADEITSIAKTSRCKYLLGSVDQRANNYDTNIKVLKSYGFKFLKEQNSLIIFSKEI
jgi:ribosomal protein S18 acetylase RimI-like enzyme